MRPALFAFVFVTAFLLVGCNTPQVIVREHYIFAEPDPSTRKCIPRITERPVLRDSADEAELIARLDDRGNDCADKLEATWAAIDDARRRAEELNRAND